MMARRAHVYPQVEPGAAALVDAAVVSVPASISAGHALALARRRDARALTAGAAVVLRDDLARAASLGVSGARATSLARPVQIGRAHV